MEAEVWIGCPGRWANFEELEESLSLSEIELILETIRDQKDADRHFLAAVNGVELPDPRKKKMEEIRERAAARLRGESIESAQDLSLEDLGIAVIRED